MILFDYTARNKAGELLESQIEAESEGAAAKILMSKDLVPVNIVPVGKSSLSFFDGISTKDKVFLIRQLATMINAGLPIAQSLKTLEDQATKKPIKSMMEQISSDVEGGTTLSVAMSKFPKTFSKLDTTLIAAGESSGNLDKSLLQMANTLEKNYSLMRKIRGATYYPVFVLVTAIIVTTGVILYVMPQMEELYTSFNAQLPIYTRAMIKFAHFLVNYGVYLLILTIGAIFGIRYYVRTPSGRRVWDTFKISIPGLKTLLTELYMARFSRTLSGMFSSGVQLLDSLTVTGDSIGNVIYRDAILGVVEKVKGGANLSDATRENPLFPPVVSEMIAVGEKTGELDNMLVNLANYFEEEVDETMKNISNLILPIFIIIIGILLVFMVLGIISPIYNFTSVVTK